MLHSSSLENRTVVRSTAALARAVAVVRAGLPPPASDLACEVDRWLDGVAR